jgi:type II secretory pathway pseudopilin PulG
MSGSTHRSHVLADDGFTLVELMGGGARRRRTDRDRLPSFLGARTRALDGAAKQSASLALRAAKIVYADHNDYGEAASAAWSTPNRRSTTPTASRSAAAH